MLLNKNTFAFNAKCDHYSIFKRLEVFIKIVESNNLSIAAQKLNLTPSSISRGLTNLEEQLGVILIKRTTRNIVLTDAGKFLYDKATKILNELDSTLIKTASFYEHPQGQLKVTCSIAFGTHHLIKLFSEYKQCCPDVNLLIDLNDQLVNLNEQNVDIALRITDDPPPNFSLRKISKIDWIYCASRNYLEKFDVPESIIELEQHQCLVNPNVSSVWQYRDIQGNTLPLNINAVIQANSSSALLEAALNDQGIVCLPTYILGEHIKSKALLSILLNNQMDEKKYYLYALYNPSKFNDPKIRSFIDFLIEKTTPCAPWDTWMNDYGLLTE